MFCNAICFTAFGSTWSRHAGGNTSVQVLWGTIEFQVTTKTSDHRPKPSGDTQRRGKGSTNIDPPNQGIEHDAWLHTAFRFGGRGGRGVGRSTRKV